MGICTHSTHSPGWLCTLVSEAADCTSTETSWARRHIFIVPCLVVAVIQSLSHVQLFVTPWTVARQAPLSMEFSRQEYWSMLTFPSPVDLPNPGIERLSLAWQADSLPLTHLGSSTILGGVFRNHNFHGYSSAVSTPFKSIHPSRGRWRGWV